MTNHKKEIEKGFNLNSIIPETGKELTPEQKKALGEKFKDLGEAPRNSFPEGNPLELSDTEFLNWLGPRTYPSRKTNREGKTKLPHLYKREWKNLQDNIVHTERPYCFCVSCLYQLYKLTHKHSRIRKDNFMFGWTLFVILIKEYKIEYEQGEKNLLISWLDRLYAKFYEKRDEMGLRFNWREANRWMYELTKDPKYNYDKISKKPKKRKQNSRNGKKYLRIILDAHINRIVLRHEIWRRALDRVEIDRFIKFWNVTTRILTFLDEEREAGRSVVSLRKIERRLSNKRLPEIKNSLAYLTDIGEILWGSKMSKVKYIGKDKSGMRIPYYVLYALFKYR